MRTLLSLPLLLLPILADTQNTRPTWIFSRQDPEVNKVFGFWLIVPGVPRDSVDEASLGLMAPEYLQIWLRQEEESCSTAPPNLLRPGASATSELWRRAGSRDTVLFGCAKFTRAGTARPIARLHRTRPIGEAGIVAVASEPISSGRREISEWQRTLLTAGLGAFFAVLGFFLQDVWRRWRDREEKNEAFRKTLFEKVAAEIWDNEKVIKAFLNGSTPVPRPLSTGGYNHVLSEPELRAHLSEFRGSDWVDRLGLLYSAINDFNDAEYGYQIAKLDKKSERLEQTREKASVVKSRMSELFTKEEAA